MKLKDQIEDWFKQKLGGGLLLPDGWYGRPYDNQHRLTSVVEENNILTISLDQKLNLHFKGLKSVEAQNDQLILRGFDKLRFDWTTYGKDAESGTKEYASGKVKIVCAAK